MAAQMASSRQSIRAKLLVSGFFLLLAAIYVSKADRHYGWTNAEARDADPVLSDGAGYYAWLPNWFVYKGNDFEFIREVGKRYPNSKFADGFHEKNGKITDKYFTGTAILLTPFFLVAHAWASWGGYAADGYSFPYMLLTGIGCICYFLLGCAGVYRLLGTYKIARIWRVCCIAILAFGTNLGFYTYCYSPYSHVFSFAIIAWLLYFTRKWAVNDSHRTFLIIIALLALLFVVRPTNCLVVILLPFLFENNQSFRSRLKGLKMYKALLPAVLILLVFMFFQLIQQYMNSGSWKLDTYQDEGFSNWLSPEIFNVLFSWGKGLFVYAPVLLLTFVGLIVVWKKDRRLFWGMALFLLVFTYMTASWWCWWYGGGLGMRPYIDFYPVMIIPIAFLLHQSRLWIRISILIFAAITCRMYQVYEFQMRNNILDYDLMSREQFFRVFMKTGSRYGWNTRLAYDQLPKSKPDKQMRLQPVSAKGPFDEKQYKLNKDDANDNPFVVVKTSNNLKNSYFGLKISADLFLYSEDATPYFETHYWKQGKAIRSDQFYIGQFIGRSESWQQVNTNIFPRLKYEDFDSVKVEFMEGNTFTGIDKLRIFQLSYKEL